MFFKKMEAFSGLLRVLRVFFYVFFFLNEGSLRCFVILRCFSRILVGGCRLVEAP